MKSKTSTSTSKEYIEDGELPQGWSYTTVGDLSETIQYGYTASAIQNSNGPRLLRITDIQNGMVIWDSVPSCDISKEDFLKYELKKGDIVFARTGATTGKSYLIRSCPDAVFASYLIRIRPNKKVDPQFLGLFFQTRDYWRMILDNVAGIAQPNCNASKLKELPIPFPPLPEQQRIVARAEDLLAHVNTTRDKLCKVPVIMKRFRQEILAAACSGRLTIDWREGHESEIHIPTLVDILARRKLFWEKRNILENSIWQRKIKLKYKEPKGPNGDCDDNIPQGWIRVTISQFAFLDVGFSFSSKNFQDFGVRLLRGENIEPGSLRWFETKYWPNDQIEGYQHLLLEEGEIVLGMDRPLISTGLKIARVKQDDLPCLLVQRVTRFKMVVPEYTELLYYNLLNEKFQKYLANKGLTGSSLPHITGSAVADYSFGLPSIEESNEIVRRVGALFERADAIDREVVAARRRCERLTQAVLGKAFRGKL